MIIATMKLQLLKGAVILYIKYLHKKLKRKLEINGKLVRKCLCLGVHISMYEPENIMPPAPSIRSTKAQNISTTGYIQ